MFKQMDRHGLLGGIGGAGIAIATILAPGAAVAGDAEVTIDNFTFAPQRLTVKAGTNVTWKNQDDIPHAVASSVKLFRSRALDTDDKYSFTFSPPGTFDYFCSIHPHMTGQVVVEAAETMAP